ncbi:MAG: TPM domain-containing protein [Ginsengibacter sp.]
MRKHLVTICFVLTTIFFNNPVSMGQDKNQKEIALNSSFTKKTVSPIKKFTIPEPVGFVNDFENIFSPTQVHTLDSMIADFYNKTAVQLAIITIDSSMATPDQVEDFTSETFKAWGLQDDGHFNGILISLSNAFKKLKIANGHGVEQVLSDAESRDLIETSFLPYLQADKYYEGTLKGLTAVMNKVKSK